MTKLAYHLYDAPCLWQWPQRALRPAPLTIWLLDLPAAHPGLAAYWPCVRIDDAETLTARMAQADLNQVLVVTRASRSNGTRQVLEKAVEEKRLPGSQILCLPEQADEGQSSLIWALIIQGIERRFEYELSALEAQLIRIHQPHEQARLCADFVSRWLDVERIEFQLPGQAEPKPEETRGAMVFCWQTVPTCALRVYLASQQPQACWMQSRFEDMKQTQVACRQSFPNLQQAGYLGRLHEQCHRILYLVGANQYCEVVWADTSKTELLSMPLKMVHRYMHKELIQVHRSYLVNPDRVQGARRKRNGRVELFLHLSRIPVGDTYKQGLEESHSHWFDRADAYRRR
ncbi:LytTR family transcriptional regulator [Ferrimonas balearica]|uniref:LytTR family DNA-binding domain-containing protein n=1 Tax=Ferrimonas balearica TaxID=44012 RepID=UPI001C56BE50|nr:LytTR family DNA-binding domain-containing protein [Ferrimonas balearica]MBW3138715.1 LytTR family transcriptional regulator [Ferrimonas balearica]MBY6105776.1 LytTR family transcriptional regulator [Ferrimonas balearica]